MGPHCGEERKKPGDEEETFTVTELKEKQVGGNHYKNGIQPFDYIRANNMCFFGGNVLKYITRYKSKNGLEDLLKAQHYLEEMIADERANPSKVTS